MSIRVETLNHLRRLTTVQEKTLRACLTYGKAAANKMVRTAKLTPLDRPHPYGKERAERRRVRDRAGTGACRAGAWHAVWRVPGKREIPA